MLWHEKTRSMLIVYVVDFRLAAKLGEHDALWASIRAVIDMGPETLGGRFLGSPTRGSPQRRNMFIQYWALTQPTTLAQSRGR